MNKDNADITDITPPNHSKKHSNIDKSAVLTVIGIILLFSTAVIVTLLAPRHLDPSWTQPTSPYQVQMYEVIDPHLYISSASDKERQVVYHIPADTMLLAFEERDVLRIISEPALESYITKVGDKILKLTSRLLLLRTPEANSEMAKKGESLQKELQKTWENEHPNFEKEGILRPSFTILELYEPKGKEAFAVAPSDSILEEWVDHDFKILDDSPKQKFHSDQGVIYIRNPQEYRITRYTYANKEQWRYDPKGGKSIADLSELKGHSLGFMSRKELILLGEHIFAIEGCWYCHSDQTRTLVQDVVLNGSDSYPAPPSSANEYIYQKITFMSTRRIGPDLSRVGIKRPSRDWHKSHFWSPQTASKGSLMPPFKHFFDDDPSGTGVVGNLPNYRFEAMFQYLMTKGTRITPPTEAWWLGKDPVDTKAIIEGQRRQIGPRI